MTVNVNPRVSEDVAGKVLVVDAPGVRCASLWIRNFGVWECHDAAPLIQWMIGMKPRDIRTELQRRGWKWSWHSV